MKTSGLYRRIIAKNSRDYKSNRGFIISFSVFVFSALISSSHETPAYKKFESICLTRSLSASDTLIIKGQISEYDAFLSQRFDQKRLDDFYSSLERPDEYYFNLQEKLGWNFRKSYKHLYNKMLKHAAELDSDGGWENLETPHFLVHFRANRYDSTMLSTLARFLEKSLEEIKSQLLVKSQSDNLAMLQIKTIYPDAFPAEFRPEAIELTGGRIQIILVSDQSEFKRFLPTRKPEFEIGGACSFEFYRDKDKYPGRVFAKLEIANIFAGYASFPLISHEIAHAVRYLYYSDYDDLCNNLAALDSNSNVDNDEYKKIFERLSSEALPGSNRMIEEAIAIRAMLGTGPINRLGMIPSFASILYASPDSDFNLITATAADRADIGFVNKLAYALGIKNGAEKKAGDFVFSWADFLEFLDRRFTDEIMTDFYEIKKADITEPFEKIFGLPIEELELEWVTENIGGSF